MRFRSLLCTRRSFMTTALTSLIIAVLLTSPADSEETTGNDEVKVVIARAEDSVTISCYDDATPSSTTPNNVEWFSRSWSDTPQPLYIFRSDRNPAFNVEQTHPNSDNYVVDRRYRLTITRVNIEYDPGVYVCRIITSSGSEHEHRYQLEVGGKPTCKSSVTEGRAGDDISLECEMMYTGNPPQMTWYAGDDEELITRDLTVIRLAKHIATRTLKVDDDRRPFRCVARPADDIELPCDVVVQVPHSARRVRLRPHKSVLQVGEVLNCTVSGNPSPQLTFSPALSRMAAGDRWATVKIPADWKGKQHTVNCTAVNELDDRTHSVTASTTLRH